MSAGRSPRVRASPKSARHAEVGDQHRPEAVRRGADAVLEIRDDLLLPVRGRGEARVGAGASPTGPTRRSAARRGDTSTRASAAVPRQLVELGVRLHEDARSLRDAVHAHVEPLRLLEHGLEAARPLRRRDLDAVLRTVREALRRVGQVVQVAAAAGPDAARNVADLARRATYAAVQRGPGLLAGDVLEPVARLAAERGADHDLQVRGLVAVVERGVDHARVEEDRVAGAERRRVLLDVLRDRALLDDDHLLLAGMAVEVVALAGLERHVHDHEVLRARCRA